MKNASLDTAIALTAAAFEGVYDKGGKPYIMHCLHVMNSVSHLGYKTMMVAVMHDLVEDTSWTVDYLRIKGFHADVVQGVAYMTHDAGETYDSYIETIGSLQMVIPIKMADLRHNSDITRLKDVREKDFARLTKYAKAYKYLEGKLI